MEFLRIIDFLGIAAFSISGVMAAIEKKLDIFGVLIIAFVTAIGGGTVRDILLGDLPAKWMTRPEYGIVILASAFVTVLFTKALMNFRKTILLFDSLGLGLFTLLGIQKGLAYQLSPGMCVALGTITGCFGGVMRDILLNRIPLIFQKEIYATACIIGGLTFFLLLRPGLPFMVPDLGCIFITVIVRLLAVKFHWRLPDLHRSKESK